jgi:hypothetical protein
LAGGSYEVVRVTTRVRTFGGASRNVPEVEISDTQAEIHFLRGFEQSDGYTVLARAGRSPGNATNNVVARSITFQRRPHSLHVAGCETSVSFPSFSLKWNLALTGVDQRSLSASSRWKVGTSTVRVTL